MRVYLNLLAAILLFFISPPAHAQETSGPKDISPSDWSSIRAAYEANRHAAVRDEALPGHYHARNPGQQWLTSFDGRGFTTTPDDGSWSWGLDLVSYGRPGEQQTVNGSACITARSSRIEYEWNQSLTEWYINDQRGFEHGYTLHHRPTCTPGDNNNHLHFTLAVRGDLIPRISETGRDVTFTTASSATVLTYNDLKVFDAEGVHLAASFQALSSHNGQHSLLLTIDDTNARYPLTIDPVAQRAYLKASNTGANDFFGASVAIYENTAVVGAPGEDCNATGINGIQTNDLALSSGAVYIFTRSAVGSAWTQQAYIKASNTGTGDVFGSSVAIFQNTVVVGAWKEDSNATGINGNQMDNSLPDSGAAYIFIRNPGGTTWTQQAYLKASNSDALDQFGYSVAITGDTVVIGANRESSDAIGINGDQANNNANESGAAYIFVRPTGGTTWTQQAYIKASNTGTGDYFGKAVAISGNTVVVGASGESSNATGINGLQSDNTATASGAAYIFTRMPVTLAWSQQAYIKASNTDAFDFFGFSVAIAADTVIIGAYGEDSNSTGINGNQTRNNLSAAGAAYIFVRDPSNSSWNQQAYLKASNSGLEDFFGYAVSISNDMVLVGAPRESSNATGINGNQANNSATSAGAAYTFVRAPSSTLWTQQSYLKASNTTPSATYGEAVALWADTMLVGASGDKSNATGVNGNQLDTSAPFSGASYVYLVPLLPPTNIQANPATVCPGDSTTLSVTSPGPGIVIDWYKDACGSNFIATGNPINVTPTQATTIYYARARRLSNGNTSDTCTFAVVSVEECAPPCSSDYNQNGGVDGADVEAFFIDWEAGNLAADVNQDGGIDSSDIAVFFTQWEMGC